MKSPFNKTFMAKSPLEANNEPEKNKPKKGVDAFDMSEDTAIKAWSKMSPTEKKIYLKRNPDFTTPKLD